MMKWLGAAGVILFALAVFLWYQIRVPDETMAATPRAAPIAPAPVAAPRVAPHVETVAVADPVQPGKVDPRSDAFFNTFDEVVPSNTSRNAAKCYTGGLHRVHRNQKLKLGFKDKIINGEVTITDVKVLESTLDDPALEACFIKEVAGTHWHDDSLPDWVQDDQLVIRPERGLKKFSPENMAYQGRGPIGPAVMTAGQPAPKSDTAMPPSRDED